MVADNAAMRASLIRLKAEAREARRDAVDVASHLEGITRETVAHNAALQREVAALQEALEAEREAAASAAAAAAAAAAAVAQTAAAEQAALREQLDQLHGFAQQKRALEAELDELRSKYDGAQQRHRGEVEELERRFMEDKARVLRERAEAEALAASTEAERVRMQVQRDTNNLVAENRSLAALIAHQNGKLAELVRNCEKLQHDNESLRRDLAIKQGMEQSLMHEASRVRSLLASQHDADRPPGASAGSIHCAVPPSSLPLRARPVVPSSPRGKAIISEARWLRHETLRQRYFP
jgi:chromosome segregation ATPase